MKTFRDMNESSVSKTMAEKTGNVSGESFLQLLFRRIKKHSGLVILFSFITFVIVFHLTAYTGHYGYDDLHYARLSADLNKGIFHIGDHYSYRWMILFCTAFCYKIFGIGDPASSFPALFIVISILWVIYDLLKNEKRTVLLLAMSLTVFSPWFLFYSDKLMPDIYLALFVFLALWAYYVSRFRLKKEKWLYAAVMAVSLFFGFLSKETILLIQPLILYLMITDILLKREIRFWIYFCFYSILITLFYFFSIYMITGETLARFEALESNAYLSLCSYPDQPASMVIKRISGDLYNLLVIQSLNISVIFFWPDSFTISEKIFS